MDFVINNYIIFMVIGVLLFMALIGYIADHKNFEKKPKKAKTKKKEDTVEPIEETPIVEEPIKVEEAPADKEEIIESTVTSPEEPSIVEPVVEEPLTAVSETPMEEVKVVQEQPGDDLMNIFETPSEFVSEPVQETPVFETVSATSEMTPLPETPVDSNVEPHEFIVESSETTTQPTNTTVSQEQTVPTDDIWKF